MAVGVFRGGNTTGWIRGAELGAPTRWMMMLLVVLLLMMMLLLLLLLL